MASEDPKVLRERNLMMIDGVGKSGSEPDRARARTPSRAALGRRRRRSASRRQSRRASASAVSELVSAGAPVDSAKVAAIRAAIAEGRYPVDPDKIAERMIDARPAARRMSLASSRGGWPARTRR